MKNKILSLEEKPSDQLVLQSANVPKRIREMYTEEQINEAMNNYHQLQIDKRLAEQGLQQEKGKVSDLKEAVEKTRRQKLAERLAKAEARYVKEYDKALKKELGGKSEFAYLKAQAEKVNSGLRMSERIPLNVKTDVLETSLKKHKIDLKPFRDRASQAVEPLEEHISKL
ncbi:MAG: hypothetical protein P4L31_02845, partial [Candidatus Babeliales bacterium]|nr:hypothetical protein [Candidatus Babeliales bacterium]